MKVPIHRDPGFTLIELLVVVAIIATLAAILTPAVRSGLTSARRVACASNLRQIGIALTGYCNEHQGRYPLTTHGLPQNLRSNAWVYTLAPYLGDVDEVRISPGDPNARLRLENSGTSYVMNEYVTVPVVSFGSTLEDYTNRDLLASPVQTHTTFIGADDLPTDVTSDHTHSRAWIGGWNVVLADIQPDRHRSNPANENHTDGAANYLYGDAHVSALKGSKLMQLWTSDPDFARPLK